MVRPARTAELLELAATAGETRAISAEAGSDSSLPGSEAGSAGPAVKARSHAVPKTNALLERSIYCDLSH
jgi:hypothetical protein